MTENRWLTLILVLFFLLGIVYALLTPVFEASDEVWHYPMIRHLADGNSLPVQVMDPAQAGPWKQEASQPPLYYPAMSGLSPADGIKRNSCSNVRKTDDTDCIGCLKRRSDLDYVL